MMGLVMSGFAFSQRSCVGITTKNISCKNTVKVGNLCHYHGGKTTKIKVESVQCSGISKSTNQQCKLKTKDNVGKCHNHRK